MTAAVPALELVKQELRLGEYSGPDRVRHYDAQRYELKHRVPIELMEEVREIAEPYIMHDPHCESLPDHRYTVRSIYYDTDDLVFYFQKQDSVKIRKKLRIRTYNAPQDEAPAFLEIKRKFGRLGAKDRLSLPLTLVDGAVNGSDPEDIVGGRPFCDRRALDRFRFNLKVRHLRPVVLVTYEREALIGRDNERIRVTFDQNLRSLINPELDQIYEDDLLVQWEDRFFVLELKFDDQMPRWMAQMIRMLNLRSHAYSKYCHGIDVWRNIPK